MLRVTKVGIVLNRGIEELFNLVAPHNTRTMTYNILATEALQGDI